MKIVWRDIKGYTNYFVNEDGDVKSLTRGRLLKHSYDKDGYPTVQLYCNGIAIHKKIHKLVIETFRGPCPDGMQACHNDGDKLNTHYTNLRYDTSEGNQADRKKHGTQIYGSQIPSSKLTETDVLEIRRLRRNRTLVSIAEEYGVTHRTISLVCRRETWRHI